MFCNRLRNKTSNHALSLHQKFYREKIKNIGNTPISSTKLRLCLLIAIGCINFFLNFPIFMPFMKGTKPEKEITIYDIAEQIGVSPATVSRALNDSPSISINTRKKINALAEKLGYRHNPFASSLRLQKTHTIGVILHELNSYFITSVLAGIEKVVTEAKYNLIIVHSAENANLEVANARNLFHKRVDGVIASLSFDTEES